MGLYKNIIFVSYHVISYHTLSHHHITSHMTSLDMLTDYWFRMHFKEWLSLACPRLGAEEGRCLSLATMKYFSPSLFGNRTFGGILPVCWYYLIFNPFDYLMHYYSIALYYANPIPSSSTSPYSTLLCSIPLHSTLLYSIYIKWYLIQWCRRVMSLTQRTSIRLQSINKLLKIMHHSHCGVL